MEPCPICMEKEAEYNADCNHAFCLTCLAKLSKCALCRSKINKKLLCDSIKKRFKTEDSIVAFEPVERERNNTTSYVIVSTPVDFSDLSRFRPF